MATTSPAPLPVRFVLAGEGPHALAPSLASGPTLCGHEESASGWMLWGFTSADLDRIGCDGCRGIARRLVEGAEELGAASLLDSDRL